MGLRRVQRGAAWAVAGHFTVSKEPAQIVLPTGSGKTAIMCLLPYLLRAERVLVVTPSRLLREQVSREFSELRALRNVGVIPAKVPSPSVAEVEHRLSSHREWQNLSEYDVVVGTPSVLSPAFNGVAPCPDDLFDLVLVDEAHHSAADTWATLLQQFASVRQALFTATPFRRDRVLLPGRTVYEYTLGAAIEEGIIEHVDFVPVRSAKGEEHDLSLARKAAQRLKDRRHKDAGSKLLVRTDRIEHAEQLVEVYRGQNIRLSLIHGELGASKVQEILGDLQEGVLDGVASVGVLGEGFDFPLIKIAVYHRGHKSLPATLQFVGRLTRHLPSPAPPAELLAVRRDIQAETRELYEEDVNWRELLPAISATAVAKERERREYFLKISEPDPIEGVAWAAVKPMCRVWVFQRPIRFNLHKPMSKSFAHRVVLDTGKKEDQIRAIITEKRRHPRWMSNSKLDTIEYSLYILVDVGGLLFVHGSDDRSVYELLSSLGISSPRRIEPEWMQRLLNGSGLESCFSVGMRSARAAGGTQASYKTIAGSSVEGAITTSESSSYALGHLFSRRLINGYDAGAFGASVSGAKIWNPHHLDLLDFRNWCIGMAETARVSANLDVPGVALPLPQTLSRYPAIPISAVFSDGLLRQGLFVKLHNGESVQLAVAELHVKRSSRKTCLLWLCSEGQELWEARINIHGQVAPISDELQVMRADNRPHSTLSRLLTVRPPTLFFADGSVAIGNQCFAPNGIIPQLRTADIECWDWRGVDIRSESKKCNPPYGLNIHEKIVSSLRENDPGSWIISDDGAGEMADIIWVRRRRDEVAVDLIHAKYSSSYKASKRLADLYEVVGQANRSTRWLQPKLFWGELHRRIKERRFTKIAYCRESRDEVARQVKLLGEEPLKTSWGISIVQPGLQMSGLDMWPGGRLLLVSCEEWVNQLGAKFRIVGS